MRIFTDRQRVAARWIIEQHDTDFSQEQLDALVDWLAGNRDNCREYVKLVRAWRWTALLCRRETPIVYPPPRRPHDPG